VHKETNKLEINFWNQNIETLGGAQDVCTAMYIIEVMLIQLLDYFAEEPGYKSKL